jgi:hypothetical protein
VLEAKALVLALCMWDDLSMVLEYVKGGRTLISNYVSLKLELHIIISKVAYGIIFL